MVHKISKPMMNKFVIVGKMWRDKVNGNTYHSATVIDVNTNEVIAHTPMEYGYGEQWKHTAFDELLKKGLVKESDRNNHELNRKRFIYVDAGFGNQRDL